MTNHEVTKYTYLACLVYICVHRQNNKSSVNFMPYSQYYYIAKVNALYSVAHRSAQEETLQEFSYTELNTINIRIIRHCGTQHCNLQGHGSLTSICLAGKLYDLWCIGANISLHFNGHCVIKRKSLNLAHWQLLSICHLLYLSQLKELDTPIPSYFSGDGNCCLKCKTSSETKCEKWEKTLSRFATTSRKVHLKYQFTNSGARYCGITDFGKQTKWRPESGGLWSQIWLNLANLDMGHSNETYS